MSNYENLCVSIFIFIYCNYFLYTAMNIYIGIVPSLLTTIVCFELPHLVLDYLSGLKMTFYPIIAYRAIFWH